MDKRYRLNGPEVVAETLDGEALIVHLGTGSYYSCRGSGEAAWAQLLAGRTAVETADELARAFTIPHSAVSADVQRFVDEAVGEGLLVETDGAVAGGEPANSPISARYGVPTLEKYTDMQELLALDPVHDVDAQAGWPAIPQVGAGKTV